VRPDVAIVIVNYRTAALTVACLRSIAEAIPGPRPQVMVVDNDSRDGSAETIAEAVRAAGFGGWVSLIARDCNDGFAAGNNAALRPLLARAEPPQAILLLNPDTLVCPGFLEPLLAALRADPKRGIVGSRLEDAQGTVQTSAFRFPTIIGEIEALLSIGPITRLLWRWQVAPPPPPGATAAHWVSGACMLIRREVFEKVGLLDDGYFLYWEELDFCLRSARAGFTSYYEPASRVVHIGGASTGSTERARKRERQPAYWFESRYRFFAKNHGALYTAVADAVWMASCLLARLRFVISGKPDFAPEKYFTDFVRHSSFVRWVRSGDRA
jgi:GT2 family glycosyltransferase